MIRTAAALALLATPAAAETPPKPGEIKTFGDWTVGCDNMLRCMMRSLGPQDGEVPDTTLLIERDAGPSAPFRLSVEAEDGAARGIAIDGKRLAAGSAVYEGVAGTTVVGAMPAGRVLTLLNAAGRASGRVSLTGASAALRYIDAQQGRAGTVTAAVAKGPAPAERVPAAPAMPVVAAIAPAGPAATPTAAQVAAMRKAADCDLEGFAGDASPETHALGGGATLILVPCSAGAYNMSAAAFVLRDGAVTRARADAPTGFGEDGGAPGPVMLVNTDVEGGTVTSYAKGRGLGDCGTAQSFVWDGTRLRLTELGVMGECRGNTGLITLWRAKAERR